MEQAIVKVSDKVWIAVGGSVYHNFCEMCGVQHDQPYFIINDSDGDSWTVCQECKEAIEQNDYRKEMVE